MISARGLDRTLAVGRSRGVHTLRSVSFEAAAGEFLVVIGAIGSGRTTQPRTVAGLESPESGVVELRGTVVFDAAATSARHPRGDGSAWTSSPTPPGPTYGSWTT